MASAFVWTFLTTILWILELVFKVLSWNSPSKKDKNLIHKKFLSCTSFSDCDYKTNLNLSYVAPFHQKDSWSYEILSISYNRFAIYSPVCILPMSQFLWSPWRSKDMFWHRLAQICIRSYHMCTSQWWWPTVIVTNLCQWLTANMDSYC